MKRHTHFTQGAKGWLFMAMLFAAILISCNMRGGNTLKAFTNYVILPQDNSDEQDKQWADYLSFQLHRRAKNATITTTKVGGDNELQITVHWDTSLDHNSEWNISDHHLTLQARSKEDMLWLLYQFISTIGQVDRRFDVSDLPPATIDIDTDGSSDAVFKYRSIYSPSNKNTDLMPIMGCGNIDYDWGLWGHNLGKVVGSLPDNAYAFDGKSRNHDQYCFSSQALYDGIVKFILNDYGDGTKKGGTRFVIMPNDNDIVCQCPICKKTGNTITSATPAVSTLIEKLARRFPAHEFFTSSYASVIEPPSHKMPANVGVIISAIDLPFSSRFSTTKEAQAFSNLLNGWKDVVTSVYVWDYMRNFDDYLSPYPMLTIVQDRLKWYRKNGISGIIFNGSGEDYASFDDMQTFVLAALMINPETDIKTLVNNYYAKFYPKTGSLIAKYYLQLEQRAATSQHGIPIYGGIADEMATYLDPDSFNVFFTDLDKASKKITGDERQRVSKLLTGLNFTALEMMRTPKVKYDNEKVALYLENLQEAKGLKDMAHYREAFGDLDTYRSYYAAHRPFKAPYVGIHCINAPTMTDGYIGSAYDYHTNWTVTKTQDAVYKLSIDKSKGTLSIGCLDAERWHIYAPIAIELWQNGKKIATVTRPETIEPDADSKFRRMTYRLPFSGIKKELPVEIHIKAPSQPGRVTTACDEIGFD